MQKNKDVSHISVRNIPVFLSANPASQMPKSVFVSKLSYEHLPDGPFFLENGSSGFFFTCVKQN